VEDVRERVFGAGAARVALARRTRVRCAPPAPDVGCTHEQGKGYGARDRAACRRARRHVGL